MTHPVSASSPVSPTTHIQREQFCSDNLEENHLHIRAELAARYNVEEKNVPVGMHAFTILGVRDTNALLESIDQALFNEDERLPYWAELWTSSVELARWCLESGQLAGKRVLELGCGLGLAGIAAARSGASVMLTDYEPDALLFARYNALRNVPLLAPQMEFRLMDWRSPGELQPFDIILASDIAYERRNFSPLLSLLRRVQPSSAIFADPDRAMGHEFIAQAVSEGFQVESQTTTITMSDRPVTVVRHTLRQSLL